jgi:uncharacterized protein (TIGR02646 family)
VKRVHKSPSCDILTVFSKRYPTAKWDKGVNNFYDYRQSKWYKRLKEEIFKEQGHLCAYCETRIENIYYYKQRIEHIHNKSDYDSTNKESYNWHLDWNNVVGVCLGGSSPKSTLYPTPQNLSCDAYKERFKVKHTDILNPLEIQAFSNLFKLEKKTGKLKANEEDCKLVTFPTNSYSTTEELVNMTIKKLNLNCDRLVMDRYEVMVAYNREIERARKVNDKKVFKKLAEKWFSQKFPSFFTTRRILLGSHAEKYLQSIDFNG